MEKVKMPYVPEDSLRIQRVEIYLQDLKERLNELRLRHDEVIHNSVEIIKEIDEVSSNLVLTQNTAAGTSAEHMTNIKKLILDFESAKEKSSTKVPVVVENRVDTRQILQNFEKLNDSQLLKDSLILFRRAKESLEKIDTLLGALQDDNKINNDEFKQINISGMVRGKINMINRNKLETINSPNTNIRNDNAPPNIENVTVANQKKIEQSTDENDVISIYASCCSSLASIQRYESLEKYSNNRDTCKNSLNGYEGDNDDSEFDIFSDRRKNISKLN